MVRLPEEKEVNICYLDISESLWATLPEKVQLPSVEDFVSAMEGALTALKEKGVLDKATSINICVIDANQSQWLNRPQEDE